MSFDLTKIVKNKDNNSYKNSGMVNNKYYDPSVESIAMTVADMDFETLSFIKEAIIQWTNQSTFGYTYPGSEYYDAVVDYMQRHHQFEISKEDILVYGGVIEMIDQVIEVFTNPKDEIIIFTPVYHPFYRIIKNRNRTINDIPLSYHNNKYLIDFDAFIEQAKKPQTKALLFCSPHNPVGRVWTKEELNKIVSICLENDLLIISDEIHFDLINSNHQHTVMSTLSKEAENISFILTSPSKTFNLAGLQCANMIVKNKNLRGKLIDYRSRQTGQSVNALGLVACQAAYTHGDEWVQALNELIETNYHLIKSMIEKDLPQAILYQLEGTYLCWLNLREFKDNDPLIEKLNKNQVFVNDGKMFGVNGEGFVRINIAYPTDLVKEMIARLIRTFNKNVSRET